MYFLDLNGLVGHLKDEKNNEYESFQYVLGWFFFYAFPYTAWFGQKEVPAGDWKQIIPTLFVWAITGLIGGLTLNTFFRSNGGRNGKHFLHRLLALIWLVGWRASLVSTPCLILFFLFLESSPIISVLGIIVVAAIDIMYCVMTVSYQLKQIHAAAEGSRGVSSGRAVIPHFGANVLEH